MGQAIHVEQLMLFLCFSIYIIGGDLGKLLQ